MVYETLYIFIYGSYDVRSSEFMALNGGVMSEQWIGKVWDEVVMSWFDELILRHWIKSWIASVYLMLSGLRFQKVLSSWLPQILYWIAGSAVLINDSTSVRPVSNVCLSAGHRYILLQCLKWRSPRNMPLKVQKGNRGIAPLILNVGTTWMWVVSIASLPLYPWERTAYPLYRRLGDGCGGEKISLPLPGFEPRTDLHKRVANRLRYTFIVWNNNRNESYCFSCATLGMNNRPNLRSRFQR